jgi:hypothetical protein
MGEHGNEFKRYTDACMDLDIDRLKAILVMNRKPKYWNLTRQESRRAIRAAIKAKLKAEGS